MHRADPDPPDAVEWTPANEGVPASAAAGRWGLAGQGAWAVVDQALFAGSNFALNLLLARWLGPAEYGVFGVAFTVFLLVATAHSALIIEPMMVFGAGRWHARFRAYLTRVLVGQAGIAVVGAGVLLAASVLVRAAEQGAPLAGALLTLMWVGPCVVLQWMLRRACYVHGRPQIAAAGGALYLTLLMGLALTAQNTVGLDAQLALGAMAVASLLAAAFLVWLLNRHLPPDDTGTPAPDAATVRASHWVYGRWAFASAILGWMANDVFYLVLTPRYGFAAAGELRAAVNLVMPMVQVLAALSTVALPWFVTALPARATRRLVLAWSAIMTGAAVVYGLILVPFAGTLVALLYGASFENVPGLVAVLALLPIAYAAQVSAATVLRAQERTREVFEATLVSAVVAGTVGIGLAWSFGVIGAAAAMVLTAAANAAVTAWRLGHPRRA